MEIFLIAYVFIEVILIIPSTDRFTKDKFCIILLLFFCDNIFKECILNIFNEIFKEIVLLSRF